MPYDANLDECLFTKARESDLDRLTVSVYSYNKGLKKLQISRSIKDSQGEFKFSKLGRMTKEEIDGILPLIQEATQVMD
ncbi:MAG: hypothetical protein GY853_07855 [PVC group bacterium]|nr:hypothetical protein [PVC group bacterium]